MSTEPLKLGGVTEEGTMICNLPLLFAGGYPTSLDKFSKEELKRFVPFMIRCSSGHDPSVKPQDIPKPAWWPDEVPYSYSALMSEDSDDHWHAVLKRLVCRCYTYHGCDFMLRFCTELSECPIQSLKFVGTWHGTTSLYNKDTGKLLVTFRNENLTYDKVESPCKTLLPQVSTVRSSLPEMVQPPSGDIFLCGGCDGEFDSYQDIKEHERVCSQEAVQATVHSMTPPEDVVMDQKQFLEYFGLSTDSPAESAKASEPACSEKTRGLKRRYQGGVNITRYHTIAFSSPLGIQIRKSRYSLFDPLVPLDRAERYCSTQSISFGGTVLKPRTREEKQDGEEWPVTWKQSSKTSGWTHKYSFSRRYHRLRQLGKDYIMIERNTKCVYAMRTCITFVSCLLYFVIKTLLKSVNLMLGGGFCSGGK